MKEYEARLADLDKLIQEKGNTSAKDEYIASMVRETLSRERNTIDAAYMLATQLEKQNVDGTNASNRAVRAGQFMRYAAGMGTLYILAGHFRENFTLLGNLHSLYSGALHQWDTGKLIKRTVGDILTQDPAGRKDLEQLIANEGKTLQRMQQKREEMEKISEEAGSTASLLIEYTAKLNEITRGILKAQEAGESYSRQWERLKTELHIMADEVEHRSATIFQMIDKFVPDGLTQFNTGKTADEMMSKAVYKKKFNDMTQEFYKGMEEAKEAIATRIPELKRLQERMLSKPSQTPKQLEESVNDYGTNVEAVGIAGGVLKEKYKQEPGVLKFRKEGIAKFEHYESLEATLQGITDNATKKIEIYRSGLTEIAESMKAHATAATKAEEGLKKQRELLNKDLQTLLGEKNEPVFSDHQLLPGYIDQFGILVALGLPLAYKGITGLGKMIPGARILSAPIRKGFNFIDGIVGGTLVGRGKNVTYEDTQQIQDIKYKVEKGIRALSEGDHDH